VSFHRKKFQNRLVFTRFKKRKITANTFFFQTQFIDSEMIKIKNQKSKQIKLSLKSNRID
jgi:hypothetical protein